MSLNKVGCLLLLSGNIAYNFSLEGITAATSSSSMYFKLKGLGLKWWKRVLGNRFLICRVYVGR